MNLKLNIIENSRTWGPDIKNDEQINNCISNIKKYKWEPSMKFEKIGKVCDFSFVKNVKDIKKNEEEFEFKTVDVKYVQKNKNNNYKTNINQNNSNYTQNDYNKQQKTQTKKNKGLQYKNMRINTRVRLFTEWSIEPTPLWQVESEMVFNELQKQTIKLDFFKINDIYFKGKLFYYDKKIDNINVKNSPSLIHLTKDNDYIIPCTSHDKNLIELLNNEKKISKDNVVIITTDQILSFLMTCVQSKYSWHLKIKKEGSKIIIDKDEDSFIDLLTVNENSTDYPAQDNENKINSLHSLGIEASKINFRFRKQVLLKNEVAEDFPNTIFTKKSIKHPCFMYRYRKINLPHLNNSPIKKPFTIIIRGEVHAKSKGTNNSYIYVCSLNEYDIKSHKNWRSQIENQKGALLANEIRNNTAKLQRFICQAFLSGCEDLKLGFISRKNLNDSENHNILSIQSHKTNDLSTQIGLKYENTWGTVRFILDIINDKSDGNYVLLKDPMKSLLCLYCTNGDEN